MFKDIKRKYVIIFIIAIISTIIISALTAFTLAPTHNKTADNEVVTQTSPTTSQTIYYVMEHNGTICVFDETKTNLIKDTYVEVFTFPDADITLLKNGIKAENDKELQRILEDYCN